MRKISSLISVVLALLSVALVAISIQSNEPLTPRQKAAAAASTLNAWPYVFACQGLWMAEKPGPELFLYVSLGLEDKVMAIRIIRAQKREEIPLGAVWFGPTNDIYSPVGVYIQPEWVSTFSKSIALLAAEENRLPTSFWPIKIWTGRIYVSSYRLSGFPL